MLSDSFASFRALVIRLLPEDAFDYRLALFVKLSLVGFWVSNELWNGLSVSI